MCVVCELKPERSTRIVALRRHDAARDPITNYMRTDLIMGGQARDRVASVFIAMRSRCTTTVWLARLRTPDAVVMSKIPEHGTR